MIPLRLVPSGQKLGSMQVLVLVKTISVLVLPRKLPYRGPVPVKRLQSALPVFLVVLSSNGTRSVRKFRLSRAISTVRCALRTRRRSLDKLLTVNESGPHTRPFPVNGFTSGRSPACRKSYQWLTLQAYLA